MRIYNVFHTWHTAITKLQHVSIEDLVENVIFGKAFIHYMEEFAANVGGDFGTIWGIVPYNSPVARSFCLCCFGVEIELMVVGRCLCGLPGMGCN